MYVDVLFNLQVRCLLIVVMFERSFFCLTKHKYLVDLAGCSYALCIQRLSHACLARRLV